MDLGLLFPYKAFLQSSSPYFSTAWWTGKPFVASCSVDRSDTGDIGGHETRRGETRLGGGAGAGGDDGTDPGGVACPPNNPKPHLDVASPLSLQGSLTWWGRHWGKFPTLVPPIAKHRVPTSSIAATKLCPFNSRNQLLALLLSCQEEVHRELCTSAPLLYVWP